MLALLDILALRLFKSGTSMSSRRQKTWDSVKLMTSPPQKQWYMEPGLAEVRLDPPLEHLEVCSEKGAHTGKLGQRRARLASGQPCSSLVTRAESTGGRTGKL